MNFWDHHSIVFCVSIFFFPRLTLLLATPWGGLLWWCGLIFIPRFLVAFLASYYYFATNPFLCVIAWFWAFSAERGEKAGIFSSYGYVVRKRFGPVKHPNINQEQTFSRSRPAKEDSDYGDFIDVEADVKEEK